MISKPSILCGLVACAAVRAAQLGAVKPIAGPMRDLSWGQLNFLHTTDTHGWLSGHLLEPQYSADWGDYISFSQHMRQLSDERGSDLLVIDTGDRIEGSGLYDGSDPKGLYQYEIYAQQKVDVMSSGNHELYRAYSVDCEHNTTVPNFRDSYVASNLDYINQTTGERVPWAQRYRRFRTKNQGIDIIAFGFLFDFAGNANNSVVQRVEDTVREEWFQQAIQQRPDLFIVTGHVGLRMDEFKAVFRAIRKENWNTPVVFFGGHMHVRDAAQYDSQSFALASGRYMETIGWMSVDGLKIKSPRRRGRLQEQHLGGPTFSRKYMDNNLLGMYYHTGRNETTFPTADGTRASKMIERAREALRLDRTFGCAPRDLWVNRAKYPGRDSIYSWLEGEVMPDIVVSDERARRDTPRLAMVNTGGIRFDIFKGPFTKDSTFTVSPFISSFSYVADVDYDVAQKVVQMLNSAPKILSADASKMPDTGMLTIPEQRFLNSLGAEQQAGITTGQSHEKETDEEEEEHRLELRGQPLTSGYTTKDDMGDDGDDTVHRPLKQYRVPNIVAAEIAFPAEGKPDKVDLVFLDFIQPWIIPALKYSGGDYDEADVRPYRNGTLTSLLADWIGENWAKHC